MAEIFVSYARDDLDEVRRLVDALRAEGLDVWWDQDVPANAQWGPTIEAQLERAGCVIVCWSPTSTVSENVRGEARLAREKGKLIQTFLDPCQAPAFFGERQGVDLKRWNGSRDAERFQFLLKGARAVLAGEKPDPGLGYRPPVRHTAAYVFAGGAILAAAAVGALWIPEIRERLFPPPPVVWQMNPLNQIDLRPMHAPDSAPIERMNSAMLIGMQAEFVNAGGRDATGVVRSQRARLRFPNQEAEPIAFNWLLFAYTSAEGPYFQDQRNAGPFRLDETRSAEEVFFGAARRYTWSEFLHDLSSAEQAGEDDLLIEFEADIESEGQLHTVSNECRVSVKAVLGYLRLHQHAFRSAVPPCNRTSSAT
jgi:hypothetical protein